MQKMDPSVATDDVPSKDPYLPPLHRVGDLIAPKAPPDMASAGLEERVLTDLAAKLVYTVTRFTTDWVASRLHISVALAADVLEQLCREGLVEETMRTGEARAHYRITQRGREHGGRALEL